MTRDPVAARRCAQQLAGTLGPEVFHRSDAAAAGVSWSRLRTAVERGTVLRLSHDIYQVSHADGDQPPGLDPIGVPTLDLLRALLDRLDPTAAVSHSTAASTMGLWIPWRWVDGLWHVIVPGEPERQDGRLRVHSRALGTGDVVMIDGVRITSPAVTAVLLARGRSLGDALVSLDSGLRALVAERAGLWTPGGQGLDEPAPLRPHVRNREAVSLATEQLRKSYSGVFGWPGTRVVREALELVDPRSESPFESWSRSLMIGAGLPPAHIGYPVTGASGAEYWSDFAWPSQRLLGEADGWGKYGDDGPTMRSRVRAERLRQQDLEAAGWRVVRWDPRERWRSWIARLRAPLSNL